MPICIATTADGIDLPVAGLMAFEYGDEVGDDSGGGVNEGVGTAAYSRVRIARIRELFETVVTLGQARDRGNGRYTAA